MYFLVLALKLVTGISLNAYRDVQGPENAGKRACINQLLIEMYRLSWSGAPGILITQRADMFIFHVRRKRPAFDKWQQRLNYGDKLPYGRYFVGKKPGPFIRLPDKFHQAHSHL